jgi:hypothetical protein
VRTAKAPKMMDKATKPPKLLEDRPRCITMVHRTSDSSVGSQKEINCFTVPFQRETKKRVERQREGRTWGLCTHVRGPGWGPIGVGRKRCWRCNPDSTLWCGWPGAWTHQQRQNPTEMHRDLASFFLRQGKWVEKLDGVICYSLWH